MWGQVFKLAGGIWGKVAGVAAAIIAFLFYRKSVKDEGRREAEVEQLEKTHDIKKRQDKVERPDPDDLDDTLDKL